METYEDDLDKFQFYLHSSFEFYGPILFSTTLKKPRLEELENNTERMGKLEVERFYNHFHMEALSIDPSRQREYTLQLMNSWRCFFENKMPGYGVTIEVCDYGSGVIVYVFETPV